MSLTKLKIDNFAIIDHIEIAFGPGLTILTGETGAGKSIIIDALNLALGEKASPNVIRAGADVATVECTFDLTDLNPATKNILKSHNFYQENNPLTLKREVNINGRSRAWLNGETCLVSVLKEVGNLLVDMHGQHDHQSLLNPDTHIEFLDAFGDYAEWREQVARQFDELKLLFERQNLLQEQLRLNREKRELWEFQLQEIQKVAPQENEYETLLQEKTILENTAKIQQLSSDLTYQLLESGDSLYNQLQSVVKQLSNLQKITGSFAEQLSRLEESQYLFQEIARQIAHFGDDLQFNPARLEIINQRLYSFQQLMKKYGRSLSDVLAYRQKLETDLTESDDLEVQIDKNRELIKEHLEKFTRFAFELSEKRKRSAELFKIEIEKILERLGISGADFAVRLELMPDQNGWIIIDGQKYKAESTGIDKVTFEISTNRGEPRRPLAEIVSGGEVSRIMLAIKTILAGRDHIPVLIFDEIDTGISGKIARKVGEELHELAKVHQVICITHLPQIAGLADEHFSVEKVTTNSRSQTQIRKLLPEERVAEIAKLIGGRSVSEITLKQARELME
ncbi:MAG TPA: DNA repair protein RecN [Candidatus Marinimicrobia bacterium]|nr:DNA repair protein RecN [Candidatus Neomarinimicrobiota bacterium]